MKLSLLKLSCASLLIGVGLIGSAAFVGNAVAQDKTAPAAAAAPAAASTAPDLPAIPADVLAKVEKHTCVTPVEPGKLSTNSAQKAFRNDLDTYRDCLIKYGETRQIVARAHIASANSAIAEYNDYVEKVKRDRDAAK